MMVGETKLAMQEPLKPCPFCGGSNLTVRWEGQPAMRYAFACADCGATVDAVSVGGSLSGSVIEFNNPQAAERWNRRSATTTGVDGEAQKPLRMLTDEELSFLALLNGDGELFATASIVKFCEVNGLRLSAGDCMDGGKPE